MAINGQSAAKRGIKMIKTKKEFEGELSKRFPYNKIKILEYTKASGPISYQCLTCGKIYSKSRANHIYENKTLCQKCYTTRRSKLRDGFLDNLERNGFELVNQKQRSQSVGKPFRVKCLSCQNEYDYKVQSTSEEFSCRYCGKNGSPVTREEFEKRMVKEGKDPKEFRILKYKQFTSSATFKHSCGQIFSQLPDNFLKGSGCPRCRPKRSKGEQKILCILEEHGVEYEEEKRFPELGRLSFDFFLPKLDILIEYQGEHHYRPINFFGGEEQFKKQQLYDQRKRDFAKSQGYQLIEIPYTTNDILSFLTFLEGSTTIRKE